MTFRFLTLHNMRLVWPKHHVCSFTNIWLVFESLIDVLTFDFQIEKMGAYSGRSLRKLRTMACELCAWSHNPFSSILALVALRFTTSLLVLILRMNYDFRRHVVVHFLFALFGFLELTIKFHYHFLDVKCVSLGNDYDVIEKIEESGFLLKMIKHPLYQISTFELALQVFPYSVKVLAKP